MSEDTIVAIATPPGRGGVGIIRLSGSKAYTIGLSITDQKAISPRQVIYTSFINKDKELIDKGIALYFKSPHSFTGEDIVELQAHGSPLLLDYLLQECITLGARLARPGEFSERAFLNDKIDLTQAEAIADLIQASSLTAARMAVRSLQGDFSLKLHQLNDKVIALRLYVEAAIDFPEEEIDFLSDGKVAHQLEEIINLLLQIRDNASQGALMREGLSVVIAGRPNAGKSTLINCLAGRDVAIVTDVAGTTRDVMREYILLDDLPIHIIDTAGLRESEDVVEKEGIKRAWEEVAKADCVLMIVDVQDKTPLEHLKNSLLEKIPEGVPLITIYNKVDTIYGTPSQVQGGISSQEVSDQIMDIPGSTRDGGDTLYLSAKTGDGINNLKAKIKEVVGYHPIEGQYLARRRHLDALDTAKNLLFEGRDQLLQHKAGELLAEDLRLAHQFLGEITGEFSSDDLLGKIFSSFCIGK